MGYIYGYSYVISVRLHLVLTLQYQSSLLNQISIFMVKKKSKKNISYIRSNFESMRQNLN